MNDLNSLGRSSTSEPSTVTIKSKKWIGEDGKLNFGVEVLDQKQSFSRSFNIPFVCDGFNVWGFIGWTGNVDLKFSHCATITLLTGYTAYVKWLVSSIMVIIFPAWGTAIAVGAFALATLYGARITYLNSQCNFTGVRMVGHIWRMWPIKIC